MEEIMKEFKWKSNFINQDKKTEHHGNQFSCKTEQSLEGFIRH